MTELTLTDAPEDESQTEYNEDAIDDIIEIVDTEILDADGDVGFMDTFGFVAKISDTLENHAVPQEQRDAHVEIAVRTAFEDVIDETVDCLNQCEW